MRIKQWFNKEKIVEAFKSLGNLRFKVGHASLLTVSLLSVILSIAFAVRMLPIRWGMELSEFDPFFQFHFTRHIVEKGLIAGVTEPWRDPMRWYPYGFDATRSSYPGLPWTAAFFYDIAAALGVPISLYDFCILFPPIVGALTCLAMYFVGKDVGGKAVGLFSAFFLALSPSYITRTSLGFFDDETVGIFAMVLFTFFFLRSIDKEREVNSVLKYSVVAGLSLGYFTASWGAALYPLALTALYVFVLILVRRYSQRLLFSYSIIFGLGLFIAINVQRLSTRFLLNLSVLPVLGVFALLCLCEMLRLTKSAKWKAVYTTSFFATLVGGFAAAYFLGLLGRTGGKYISVLNPFYRLTSPLIESVAEHHVSAWGSIYYDFGIGVLFFALGLFFAARNLTNRNLFFIVFGLTSLYFASSMVRLTLLLALPLSVLWALGLVRILKPFVGVIKEAPRTVRKAKYRVGHVGKEFGGVPLILIFLLLMFTFALPPSQHSIFSHAYSPVTMLAGGGSLRPGEPILDWVDTLNYIRCMPEDTVICSWWDYGYWIRIRGNRTSLADNGTQNRTQIQQIGLVFMSNETQAIKILKERFAGPKGPPSHMLVFTTFLQDGTDGGYGGDESKWPWMARIANGTTGLNGDTVILNDYDFGNSTLRGFLTLGEDTVIQNGEPTPVENPKGKNTTLYKLMHYPRYEYGAGPPVELNYFRKEYFSDGFRFTVGYSAERTPVYAYLVVALYKVDYDAYEADYPSQ